MERNGWIALKFLILAVGVVIGLRVLSAQAPAWKPSPGHTEVPIWPGPAPDAHPLYELMKQQVLGSKAIQTDDRPVPVLDPDLPHTRTGRIWTYVGDSEHPYTVYDYTPNRSRDGPEEFLKAFRGYLQADAYSGYDHFYEEPERGMEEVACWRTQGGSTMEPSPPT